jgi:CheY-like chemotaxis protein
VHRVLIVDDEPAITRIIETKVLELGCGAFSIHSSDQFAKALAAIKPTIIFLDIAMPGRDGMELIGDLSAGNYPGKLVIMSGTDPKYIELSSTLATARGLIVAGTLTKPFRQQQIVDLLTKLTSGQA